MASQAFKIATQMAAMDGAPKDYADQIDAKTGFTILYPNGGSEGSPATVGVGYREELTNPFPGSQVICQAELLIDGKWGKAGWIYAGTDSRGAKADQLGELIVMQTGALYVTQSGGVIGSPHDLEGTLTSAPCRILVWKTKGALP